MKRIFVCLVMLLSVIHVFGNGIEGHVMEIATGEPIAGANVYILEMRNIGAATDIDGNYKIINVPEGKWTLVCSNIAHKIEKRTIKVYSGSDMERIDFELASSVSSMDAVITTATRQPRIASEVPIRTQVISEMALREKSAGNVYEALENEPGIRVEQQCSNCNFSMLRMSGLEGGYAQVLIDGQPIFTGLSGVYGLEQIQTGNVDQIEIVKGAGSALYGSDALGGVVNIRLKEPSVIPKMNFGASVGTNDDYSLKFNGTMRREKLGVSYAFQYDQKGEIDQTGNTDEDFVEVSNFEDAGEDGFTDRVASETYGASLNAHLFDILGEKSKVVAYVRTMGEFRKGGYIETFDDPFDPDAEHIRTTRCELGTNYTKMFDKGNSTEFNLGYTYHYRNATNGAAWDKGIEAGVFDDDLSLTEYGQTMMDSLGVTDFRAAYFPQPFISTENLIVADLKYIHPVAALAGDFLVGAQYRGSRLEQEINGDVPDNKSADDIGIFAQLDIFPFTEKFEFIAGVRADIHNSEDEIADVEYSENVVNPRFAARYNISDDITLRANFGTGFRVPYLFAEDLHLCASSPRIYKGDDLEPEKAVSMSVGIDYDFSGHEIGLSVFNTNIDNKIEFVDPEGGDVPDGYDFRWRNFGKANTKGVEFAFAGQPQKWLEYSCDFVYTDAKFEDMRDPEIENSDYIPRSPALTGNLGLTLKPGNFRFSINAGYTGSMYIDHVPNEDEELYELVETDAFVLVNARASYKFIDKLELYISVENLTDFAQPDRDITDAAFMYAPLYGRTMSVGFYYDLMPF